jgi:hypothetical protein
MLVGAQTAIASVAAGQHVAAYLSPPPPCPHSTQSKLSGTVRKQPDANQMNLRNGWMTDQKEWYWNKGAQKQLLNQAAGVLLEMRPDALNAHGSMRIVTSPTGAAGIDLQSETITTPQEAH